MISIAPTFEQPKPIELDWLPPSEPQPPSRRLSPAERARIRRGWLASGAVHFVAALVGLAYALWLMPMPSGGASRQVEIAASAHRPASEPPLLTLPPLVPAAPTAADLAAAEIARLSAKAIPPELRADLLDENKSLDPPSAAGQWVLARMRDEIDRAEQLSRDEQLARLKSLTGQLDRISSEDSVTAVTGRLASLLGAEDRAQEPAAEPIQGEFDFTTAQVHDVKRSESKPGQFEYVAILLDAQGRTMETPLSPAEGEQLYRVMELVKANPLLERIYRGLAMSLMDKVLQPAPQP